MMARRHAGIIRSALAGSAAPSASAAGLALMIALALAGCRNKEPTVLPSAPPTQGVPTAPAPTPAAKPLREAANVEEYKTLVAEHIVAANPALIFSHKLPPMLPAIVVLDIGIDREGKIHQLKVHRSRDDKASTVAMEAVRNAAPFPKPVKLVKFGHKDLVFSETFLFNKEYQFQVRTLAGPQ